MIKRKELFLIFFSLALGLLASFLFSEKAQAASLYFSPSLKSISKGSIFSVGVYVSSVDQSINAVSGTVNFSSDNLEVVSLSKTGSIINFWVQEPSFSNSTGNVSFEGIILNPGFKGEGGKILEISLKAKSIGVANLIFSNGAVLANDGQGTNILKETKSARIEISETKTEISSLNETILDSGLPSAPLITSSTHPNPNEWYANKNPEFSWNLPSDIVAVRLLYDRYPNSQPTIVYSPPISSKKLEDLADGVWYFHAQFKNAKGWGGISHFRFQIDSTPPQPFNIKAIKESDFDSQPTLLFNTNDDLSGILKYKVKIGDGDFIEVSKDLVEHNPYPMPPQAPGKRLVLVQAFDKAGNFQTSLAEVEIKALDSPLITNYPKVVKKGEAVVIEGQTYPQSTVNLWLERKGVNPAMYTSLSDDNGRFRVIINDVEVGDYQFWVEVVDKNGSRSLPSQRFSFSVTEKDIIRIGSFLISTLTVIVSLLAIIFLLMTVFFYLWKKFAKFKIGLKKEVKEAEKDIHRTLIVLYKNVESYIRFLEKVKSQRKLTLEEEKILEKLRKDFDYAEKAIKSEVEEIEDDLD